MDSAAETKSSEKETITCSSCQDILQNPRRLECLHSYCDKCLKNVDRVIEKGRRGVLCPLCRRFTSEPHIKKDPILEVLVEALAQYYDKNIRNQGTLDKSCSQCDSKVNVIYYCEECEVELCQKCETRHRRLKVASEHRIVPIAEAGTHPVVNVTQYCPKHSSKPIKVSCVPCKLAICVDCKFEDHDTHKTEDIDTALSSVLPEVRASCPVLEAERIKHIEGKQELASLVSNLTHVEEQILNSAAKARDEVISMATRDFNEIKERLTNHVQVVRKEASLREDSLNNCISSIESMTSWINVLADKAQGSAVLYEVRNEKLLERIQSLLRDCKETRNVAEFHKKARKRVTFTKTDLKCDNIIGTVGFDKPPQEYTSKSEVARAGPISSHKPPQVQVGNRLVSKVTSIPQSPDTSVKPKVYKPDVSKKPVSKPVSQLNVNFMSARHTERNLWGAVCEEGKSFKLERVCWRFIHHQGSLWCPCPNDNTLDRYTPEGKLQTSVTCEGVDKPQSLHPLSATHMMLAAGSGLYVYDIAKQAVSTKLVEGVFWDVHVKGENVVALEVEESEDRVHVFSKTHTPTQMHSFSVKHCDAYTVILQKQRVHVSAFDENTSVSVFTLEGQVLSQWGSEGDSAPGEMDWPLLCGMDSEDHVLIADQNNHCVQLINSSGEFSVMRGVKVKYPCDVAVVGGQLLVLNGFSEKYIQTYQIRKE